MHKTDTVDVTVVISGELVLELDDGAEVTLRPGAVVVQNGVRHAWRNRSDEPCLMAIVVMSAEREEAPG
jgi:quercetin dioxygenase-like cupin family protein